MKVLICGSSGFIGSNLLNYLSKLNKKKFSLIATYHKTKPIFNLKKKIKFIKIDLKNKIACQNLMKGVDVVIQCAARTSGSKDILQNPYIHITDNIVMNAHLLESAHLNKIKHFIFLSCSTMYKSSNTLSKEENFLDKNIEPKYFGVANMKLYCEKLCKFYSNIGNTKFTIVRHSNIYGPNDKFDKNKSHVLGATISKIYNAQKEITVWGKGNEKRDFLYIDDLSRFILLAIKKQKNKFQIYNCGSSNPISIKNLVKKIIKISKKKLLIKYDTKQPNININIGLNCNYAKKKLNWFPKISIEEGLSKTYLWYVNSLK